MRRWVCTTETFDQKTESFRENYPRIYDVKEGDNMIGLNGE